ncbi:DUF2407 domain containing protein [Nitzschia inconspicua]|uniref:DUF2407 domain containing protein n=1 Tax=Nitzschia inconspicua TaxID=303405 RepID=A0A9K3LE67_9STRA|nr:DUF2407 domain containing protein [Nitzschia inconspicua]
MLGGGLNTSLRSNNNNNNGDSLSPTIADMTNLKAIDEDDDLLPLPKEDEGGLFHSLLPGDHQRKLQLRIKSFQDVTVQVPSDSNVSQLKELIRTSLGTEAQDRYLRLICKGRLLHPDDAPISEFKVHNNDVVHAVLAAPGVRAPTERRGTTTTTANSSSTNTRRRGGTIVGPGGRVTRAPSNNGDSQWGSDDSNNSSDEEDLEQGRERLGFDRLRTSGLRRQEITAIRMYFGRHVDRHIQLNPNDHDGESDLRRRRLLYEEDWMSLQGPTSEFRLNLSNNTLLRFASVETNWRTSLGTDRDFMWGFLLGFFVGLIMLVWVWMPTVPHKQKIGILTGISFQLAMSVLRQENEDEFADGE